MSGLTQLDINLFYFFNNFAGKSNTFDALIIFFAEKLPYILIIAFIIFVFKLKEKKWPAIWTALISTFFARFVITELIRYFYHRPRPFMVLQVHQLLEENKWSFPSGHSAFFFALATAVYFYNKKLGIAFFLGALIMNISRIISGVHYPSDILGGIAIGIITSYAVFFFLKKLAK